MLHLQELHVEGFTEILRRCRSARGRSDIHDVTRDDRNSVPLTQGLVDLDHAGGVIDFGGVRASKSLRDSALARGVRLLIDREILVHGEIGVLTRENRVRSIGIDGKNRRAPRNRRHLRTETSWLTPLAMIDWIAFERLDFEMIEPGTVNCDQVTLKLKLFPSTV